MSRTFLVTGKKISELLHRIGQSRGNPTLVDCAMASIYADFVDSELAKEPAPIGGTGERRQRTVNSHLRRRKSDMKESHHTG